MVKTLVWIKGHGGEKAGHIVVAMLMQAKRLYSGSYKGVGQRLRGWRGRSQIGCKVDVGQRSREWAGRSQSGSGFGVGQMFNR